MSWRSAQLLSPSWRLVSTLSGVTTRRLGPSDLMIAAVAAAQGLPLYTTNPDDFAGLDRIVDIVPVPRPDTGRG